MRRAFTLLELLCVLAFAGLATAVAVPRFLAMRDRLAVTAAANDLHALLDAARTQAWLRNARVVVVLDSVQGQARLMHAASPLMVRPVAAAWGVSLTYTQDSIGYASRAMGFGASNSTIVVRRGAQQESLHVSRLGRVRR